MSEQNGKVGNKTYDVFISHKSDCKPWVRVLAQNLKEQGYKLFLDEWELVPAKSIVDGLYQGLNRSKKAILVATPEAFESGWVREEYHQMMIQKQEDKDFVIIPLVLGKEIPDFPFMKDILWVDFRDPDKYRESFYRLLCALEGNPPGTDGRFEGDLILPQQSKEPIQREKPLLLLPEKITGLLQGTAVADESPDNAHQTFHHTSFGEMAYVFISYIHENKREVDRLCDDLRKRGIQVWLDRERITPGQRWKYAIREAIQKGSYFIACFSHEYNHRIRSHMNEELTLAVDELRKRPTDRAWFIPVLFSGEVPDRSIGGGETLRDIQWIDLKLDWESGIRKILNVVAPNPAEQPKIELLKKELENKDLLIKKMTAMTEMKTIGNAVESYITDYYKAPQATTMEELRQQLEPLYIKELPLNDPWGKPYQYRPSPTDESEYTITCTGNEYKIVYANGNFLDNH